MTEGPRITKLREIVEQHQAGIVDNFYVDVTTAQMLVVVHDALKTQELRDKFERLPLRRLVDFGWAHVRVGSPTTA